MQIELPQDLIDRVQQRAASAQGATEADVIRRALDSLDWLDRERKQSVAGIQESIAQYDAGEGLPVDEAFDEVRAKLGWEK